MWPNLCQVSFKRIFFHLWQVLHQKQTNKQKPWGEEVRKKRKCVTMGHSGKKTERSMPCLGETEDHWLWAEWAEQFKSFDWQTQKFRSLDNVQNFCSFSTLSLTLFLKKKKKVIKINSFMWPCLPSPFTEQQNVHCPCNLYQKVWLHCLSIHSIMTGFTTPLIIAKELTSLLV